MVVASYLNALFGMPLFGFSELAFCIVSVRYVYTCCDLVRVISNRQFFRHSP